jgi:hypothetical protein
MTNQKIVVQKIFFMRKKIKNKNTITDNVVFYRQIANIFYFKKNQKLFIINYQL